MIAPLPPDGRGVHVGVADVGGTGRGLVLAASASGDHAQLALVDPFTGSVLRNAEPAPLVPNGLYATGGDLDRDGRDEIVVTPGWGGDSAVRILDGRLTNRQQFGAYSFNGVGMSVATPARIGLPLVAQPRTVRFRRGLRTQVVVARFRDAAGAASHRSFRATIDWGDGTRWNGVVLNRGGGVYDVRSTKRYRRTRSYAITVTLVDDQGPPLRRTELERAPSGERHESRRAASAGAGARAAYLCPEGTRASSARRPPGSNIKEGLVRVRA